MNANKMRVFHHKNIFSNLCQLLQSQRSCILYAAIFLLLCLPFSTAVTCNSCQMHASGSYICDKDCTGDMCYYWKSSQGQGRIQGCLSGLPKAMSPGCQKNDVGALQCLCNDQDLCNTKELEKLTAIALPAVSCRKFEGTLIDVKAQDIQNDSPPRSCNSALCFYHKTRNEKADGSGLVEQESGGCPFPDSAFEYLTATHSPGPGAMAGSCYSIQFKDGENTLGCICSENDCNKDASYPLLYLDRDGPVECHLGFYQLDDAYIEPGKYCKGQYCIIQKERDSDQRPRYSKGCLTVSRYGLLGNTGYRRILGIEQWICDKNRCNIDINNANSTESTGSLRDETNVGSRTVQCTVVSSLITILFTFILIFDR